MFNSFSIVIRERDERVKGIKFIGVTITKRQSNLCRNPSTAYKIGMKPFSNRRQTLRTKLQLRQFIYRY